MSEVVVTFHLPQTTQNVQVSYGDSGPIVSTVAGRVQIIRVFLRYEWSEDVWRCSYPQVYRSKLKKDGTASAVVGRGFFSETQGWLADLIEESRPTSKVMVS